MALKDHYKTLGVSNTASADDIKKAYRKMAKKYHPDATGGDKAKEAKFKEISEAYEVLGDPKRKSEYDMLRSSPFGGAGGSPFGGAGGTRGRRDINIDLNDLFGGMGGFSERFGDMFGNAGGAAGRTGAGGGTTGGRTSRARRAQRGADIEATLELSLPEAALGVEKTLGLHPFGEARQVTVRIPAGVMDGETIKVAGLGKGGTGLAPPGDLLIKVQVLPHPQFRRQGHDLEVDVPIRFDEAALGAKAEVPTLEGKALVNVPAGTSSGLKLRLRGKGAGDRKGGRGDLYAVIQITVPKTLSDEAKALIEKLRELTK